MKINIELGDIQKTLFMPVRARTVETRKKNPLISDKTAIEIIRSVDLDFMNMSKNISEISRISWIARCKRFDMVITDFLRRHPEGTIVNIGCGLDTTDERINNKSINWYDLDLPDVIALRKKFLNESDNRKFIASSFLDSIWFNEIAQDNKILSVSTGMFSYFEESVIKEFFLKIANKFCDSELFFDVTSPKGV